MTETLGNTLTSNLHYSEDISMLLKQEKTP